MIRFYHGDAIEIMKMLIFKKVKVDAIITDPPYGTTACKWDVIIPLKPMWQQINRIIKEHGAIVMTSSQPFTSILINSNLKMFKYEWIWHKNKASGHLNAKKMPMKAHENIVVFGKSNINYYPQKTKGHNPANYAKNNKKVSEVYGEQKRIITGGSTERYPRSVLNISVVNNDHSNGKRYHTAQKPERLMEYLIETYTKEGDTILDFAMGSGTTGVSCKKLNRNFIGIDSDIYCFNTANERIENNEPE